MSLDVKIMENANQTNPSEIGRRVMPNLEWRLRKDPLITGRVCITRIENFDRNTGKAYYQTDDGEKHILAFTLTKKKVEFTISQESPSQSSVYSGSTLVLDPEDEPDVAPLAEKELLQPAAPKKEETYCAIKIGENLAALYGKSEEKKPKAAFSISVIEVEAERPPTCKK